MFGKTKKRIKALEARLDALETTKTLEYGDIPTSQLWRYVTKLICDKLAPISAQCDPKVIADGIAQGFREGVSSWNQKTARSIRDNDGAST